MPQLPGPVRAALGLVATVVDGERSLPDRALELPVLAVSTALQMSLRAQQRYAILTAKGDEFLSQLRGAPDEPPEWARFDDDPTPPPTSLIEPVSAADEDEQFAENLDQLADEIAAPAPVPTRPLAKSTKARKTSTKPAVAPAAKSPAQAATKPSKSSGKRKPSAFDQAVDPLEEAIEELPELEGYSIPPAPES